MAHYVNILSIAGSDPMGCAGIQADILTGNICGVHVATAVSAVTVQSTGALFSVNAVDPSILRAQIETVASDVDINAVKIGMLPTHQAIEVVSDTISRLGLHNVVIDPIGTTTAGDASSGETVSSLSFIEPLLSKAAIITPNLKEAQALLDMDLSELPLREVAWRLHKRYNTPAVLVTGGDLQSEGVVDSLYCVDNHAEIEYFGRRIQSDNTHGTGCALSTAIASYLAIGCSIPQAVARAEQVVHRLINAGSDYTFGKHNYGPLGFLNYTE